MVSVDRKAAAIVGIAALVGVLPHAMANSGVLYQVNDLEYFANGTVVNDTGNTANIGVNAGQTLRFGSIPEGSASMKFINVSARQKTALQISSTGNISKHLEFSDWNYFEGTRELRLRFNGSEPGYYEGTVSVKTRTPRNRVGKAWLDATALLR